jgi:hypothetical protein
MKLFNQFKQLTPDEIVESVPLFTSDETVEPVQPGHLR